MTSDPASAKVRTAPSLRERVEKALLVLNSDQHTGSVAAGLFVLAVLLMLMYRPFNQLEVGDSAGYDYIAQSILRGQVPYRDVVDMKTPASMYLSAFAMATGKLAGVRDVIAVRLFQALMVGLLSVVIFYVGRAYLRNSAAGLIAAVLPLTCYKFAEWTVVGTQPKLPMILFGMLCLLFIAKGQPFWAGVFSTLSFLCWQPGLMFTGVALLMFSNYLTSWRDMRAARVVLGAAVPLVIVFGYFYSRGALGDLWAWTITFNYSVFAPETQREPLRALIHIWSVMKRAFGVDAFAAAIGAAGFTMFAVERARRRLGARTSDPDLFRDALLIPPVVYFAFCLINMQSGPDLIPFIPFFGIFAGWFVVKSGQFISTRQQRVSGKALRWDLLVLAAGLILIVAFARGTAYWVAGGHALQDQERQFRQLSDLLGPGDTAYVHGYAELLVLLNRPNLNPYPFLNQGIDGFAASRRGGDFNVILDEMEAGRPKLVVLARMKTVASREMIERWVDQHYDKLESFGPAQAYIRKGD
jgi:hypothetical protein